MDNIHAEERVRYFAPESREKSTLIALSSFGDSDGTNIYCKVETLAARAGISERTAQRHLRKLEGRGEVVTKMQGSGRRTSAYEIPICAQVDSLSPSTIAQRKRLLQENLFHATEKERLSGRPTKGDRFDTPPNIDFINLKGSGDTSQGKLWDCFSGKEGEGFLNVGWDNISDETKNLWDETRTKLELEIRQGLLAPERTPGEMEVAAEWSIVSPAQS